MGQKAGEKWTAAAKLQPTIPKSDRLLVTIRRGAIRAGMTGPAKSGRDRAESAGRG